MWVGESTTARACQEFLMGNKSQLRSNPVRGMRDILPDEVQVRDWAQSIIQKVYESYGFSRIETPALENIDLLKRGDGGENQKLIFEVLKRGDKLQEAVLDLTKKYMLPKTSWGEAEEKSHPDDLESNDRLKREWLTTEGKVKPALQAVAQKELEMQKGESEDRITREWQVLPQTTKEEVDFDQANAALLNNLCDTGMRFDLTVPLVRYYADNMNSLPNPFKALQIGSVWRAERPQKGRFRQFTQCDIDIIGDGTIFAELELISATTEALLAMGFENFVVRINDRRILNRFLENCGIPKSKMQTVSEILDNRDKFGWDGVRQKLHDILSHNSVEKFMDVLTMQDNLNKSTPGEQQLNEIGGIADFTRDQVFGDLLLIINTVKALKDKSGGKKFDIVFDPLLVRGMGYYTGPVFEVSMPEYGSSVAGGGRYDRMIEKFLDRSVPACGFSIGFERIIQILMEKGSASAHGKEKIALLYDGAADDAAEVMQLASSMRSEKRAITLMPKKKEMRKQLDLLMSQGFTAFCVFKKEGHEIKQLGNK